ncbi:MAG: hypothetical protein R2864_09780 [Syntrophotaleaceae bacterium]
MLPAAPLAQARGFTPLDKKVYALVDLRDLQNLFEAGSVVDLEARCGRPGQEDP